jgi:hypothetical protein
MNKKLCFLRSCLGLCCALCFVALILAGSCKALADDGADPDYLMPLPNGVIVRYETGNGSYVPYRLGLAPGEKITRPPDPVWPNDGAVFGGWFKDDISFTKPWDFDTDTISADAGKYMTLYAQWEATQTERWVARNYIWENQGSDVMGQVAELEPGEEYTLTVKCWMQGGNDSQVNHVAAFYLDPDTGVRAYSVRQPVSRNNLWTELTYIFIAGNRWYVVGVFPGLATSGGGTFYLREMKLAKTGDTRNILRRSDFKFGIGLDEDKIYYTQASLAAALTAAGTGKSDSFLPGIWYYASSRFDLIREQSFWSIGDVAGKIASQGGVVFLDDRE